MNYPRQCFHFVFDERRTVFWKEPQSPVDFPQERPKYLAPEDIENDFPDQLKPQLEKGFRPRI